MNMSVVDEEHMEIAWRINQFEGKGGITPQDFKMKAQIDIKLMAELNDKMCDSIAQSLCGAVQF